MLRGLFAVAVLLLLALNLHYTFVGLDNQTLIHDKAAPDTHIVRESRHTVSTYYVPVHTQNETTYACGEAWAKLHLNHTRHYRGVPVEFTLDFGGCISHWEIHTPGLTYEEFNGPYGGIVYYEGGYQWIRVEAHFHDGSFVRDQVNFYIGGFAPPDMVPNESLPIYEEYNWFEDHPEAYITFDTWLSDTRMYHDRSFVEPRVAEHHNGNHHAGYDYGVNGFTVNTFVHTNVKGAEEALIEVAAWTIGSTFDEHGSCKHRYETGTILYRNSDGLRLWLGEPMGCNMPDGLDGVGWLLRYEHDGYLAPKWTPWYGAEGPGYLFDYWDAAEVGEYRVA